MPSNTSYVEYLMAFMTGRCFFGHTSKDLIMNLNSNKNIIAFKKRYYCTYFSCPMERSLEVPSAEKTCLLGVWEGGLLIVDTTQPYLG